MQAKHDSHVKRILILLVIAAILGLLASRIFRPEGFGKFGHYRAGSVTDEINRETRHMTNESCLSCHPFIKEMHLAGVHKSVSCEFCHGAFADHIKDDKKFAALPVIKGNDIKRLCLRCHNQIIRARPKESIKMVTMPNHLEEKKVNVEHNCDQCHNVHAPLIYVKRAKDIFGVKEVRK